jgi:lysophospholipase L1-like esterase
VTGREGGVVIVGDSIASGYGKSVGDVQSQSWGQWLAEAADLSFTKYALGGAPVAVIRRELLTRVEGRYDIACAAIGTNDTVGQRDPRLRLNIAAVIGGLAEHADRLVTIGLPPELNLPGRRTDRTRIIEVNELLAEATAVAGGVFVPLDWFRGHRLFRGDMVHPSAFGHLEIADAAAQALGFTKLPSQLHTVRGHRTALERVVYAAEYGNALAKSLGRALHP